MFSDAVMFRPPHETYGTEWTRQFALSDQRGKDPRHFQVAADAGKVVGASRVPAIIVSVNQHRRKRGVSTRNLRPNHVIVACSNICSHVGTEYELFSRGQLVAQPISYPI